MPRCAATLTLAVLWGGMLGCSGAHDLGSPVTEDAATDVGLPPLDAAPDRGAPRPMGDATIQPEAATGDGGTDAVTSACGDGLLPDGPFCVGWLSASPWQPCLRGQPKLVQTDLVLPWMEQALLAVQCDGEPPQVYVASEDRWERREDVTMAPVRAPALPDPPTQFGFLAASALPDGTGVAIDGSLHAVGPFATWIVEPGGSEWRRSIDGPWMYPFGAAPVGSDTVLFAGDASFLFVRRRRP